MYAANHMAVPSHREAVPFQSLPQTRAEGGNLWPSFSNHPPLLLEELVPALH